MTNTAGIDLIMRESLDTIHEYGGHRRGRRLGVGEDDHGAAAAGAAGAVSGAEVVMANVIRIPAPMKVATMFDRFSVYMNEDCEKPDDIVLAVACRGMDEYLGDLERLIVKAQTKEEAVRLRNTVVGFAARINSLWKYSEDQMETFDFTTKGAV